MSREAVPKGNRFGSTVVRLSVTQSVSLSVGSQIYLRGNCDIRCYVVMEVVLTGSWQRERPRAQRGAGPPTSESHPGKPAACLCGYLATGWSCHRSLDEKNTEKS